MNIREIEKLLDKYYEGLTSVDEEMVLKDFFQGENIPPSLLVHAEHFRYCKAASGEEIKDPFFEQKILDNINKIPVVKSWNYSRRFYYISGIAAGILLLVGLVFMLNDRVVEDKPVTGLYYNADAELAFVQTCDILALVSDKFNLGMDKINYLGQFDKAIRKTEILSKFYQYETLIINPDPFQVSP